MMVKMRKFSIFITACLMLGLSYIAGTIAHASGSAAPSGAPGIGSCPLFPADNPWNRDISQDPVHPNSDAIVSYINGGGNQLGFAFGNWLENGIPYNVVPGTQPKVPVTFTAWGSQSDPGPYPIPPDPLIEGMNIIWMDRHLIVVDKDNCMLYELHYADYVNGEWTAQSGAIFNLRSNQMRPEGWTSADAAGLPIFPGLVRYEEVATGAINHALRFVVAGGRSRASYIFPARHHQGNNTNVNAPPMGTRVRLKANFDISGYTGHARIILQALKKYGMILADESDRSWVLWGMSTPEWDRLNLETLRTVPSSAFEVVDANYSVPVQTAASATTLKLQYRTAESLPTDNKLQPVFNILNTGIGYGVLSELKIRYYFTNEDGSTLQAVCIYAQMGCDTLKLYIVKLPQPLDRADHYLEIGFNSRAGTVYSGQSTGSIQIRINQMDWHNLNESNDYSYNPNLTAFGDWRRITMYRNDQLIWGFEPLPPNVTPTAAFTRTPTRAATSSQTAPTATRTRTPAPLPTNTPGSLPTRTATTTNNNGINLQYRGSADANDSQSQSHFNLINTGTTTLQYSSIKIRYWFTPDSTSPVNFRCDWAPMTCANVIGTIVPMQHTVIDADTYLEVGFTAAAGSLAPGGQSGAIQISMYKTDWSAFNETNDYSYDPTKIQLALWQNVTVYYAGTKVWGNEPLPSNPSGGGSHTPTATRIVTRTPTRISTLAPSRTPTRIPTTTTVPPTTVSSTATRTATRAATATSTILPTRAPSNTPTRIPATTTVPPTTVSSTATRTATRATTATSTALPTRAPSNTPTRIPATTTVPPTTVPPTATRTATSAATLPPTTTSPPRPDVDLQYRASPDALDAQSQSHFNLINAGTMTVQYSDLKVRYWFTPDSTSPVNFRCDWAPMTCANVTGRIVAMPSPLTGASHYLEVGFTSAAGSLAPGAQSGAIQVSMYKSDWSNFNEIDDYSYDGTKSQLAFWTRVGVYHAGVRIWGVEPNS